MSTIVRAFGITVVLVVLIDGRASAQSAIDRRDALLTSERIQFQPAIRPQAEEMLRRSPTFRLQYNRIAASPAVLVGVVFDAVLCDGRYKAKTTIRRYQSGLILVQVSLGPGFHQEEWIAHEFEHILEQLEGQKLLEQANSRSGSAWFSGADMFETTRAIRAGRAVRDELLQPRNTQ